MICPQVRIIFDRTPAPTEPGDWHDVTGHHRYYGSSAAMAANGWWRREADRGRASSSLSDSEGPTVMTAATAGLLVLLFLPFLLSLAARPVIPKILCLETSVLALLFSQDIYRVVLCWAVGMMIAVISVHDRMLSGI
jgi:hypothetical protein